MLESAHSLALRDGYPVSVNRSRRSLVAAEMVAEIWDWTVIGPSTEGGNGKTGLTMENLALPGVGLNTGS